MELSEAVEVNTRPKKAYYVERDLEFGQFDWDIVDNLRVAKTYTFWNVATIHDLYHLYKHRKKYFHKLEVAEGIVEWNIQHSLYVLIKKQPKKKTMNTLEK